MKQGEIWWADLNPVKGSEQKGVRPVVVVSGNAMNDNMPVSIVCPLSSQIKNYNGCVLVKKNSMNNLQSDSEIITFQIRALSQTRLTKKIGDITSDELSHIKKGLFQVLTY